MERRAVGAAGMDHRLRGSPCSLRLRVPFLSRVESCSRVRRHRSPDGGGDREQLGRRSVHQLRGCDVMDGRRDVVVVCRIDCVSPSLVVDNAWLARFLDLYHLQRDSCLQRWFDAMDRASRMFDLVPELGSYKAPTFNFGFVICGY